MIYYQIESYNKSFKLPLENLLEEVKSIVTVKYEKEYRQKSTK